MMDKLHLPIILIIQFAYCLNNKMICWCAFYVLFLHASGRGLHFPTVWLLRRKPYHPSCCYVWMHCHWFRIWQVVKIVTKFLLLQQILLENLNSNNAGSNTFAITPTKVRGHGQGLPSRILTEFKIYLHICNAVAIT